MSAVIVRHATQDDIPAITALANKFNKEDGGGQPFTDDTVRRFGFGTRPLFTILLAETARRRLGYAMICDVFDSERAAPGLWLQDLYVDTAGRRRGVGRRLMAAVAAEATHRGAGSIWWGVRNRNTKAIAFYMAMGAVDDDARILEIKGDAVTALARSNPSSRLLKKSVAPRRLS